MKRLNRLIKLSPGDWLLLLVAYRWLLWARWQMISGRPAGRELLEGNLPAQAGNVPVAEDGDDTGIRRRVRFISLASRYPRRWSWCLQSSLALREWLARGGVFADLRIGVRKRDGQFQAHAWLEYRGRVLNDSEQAVAAYAALERDRG
jgi:hypothetical protein